MINRKFYFQFLLFILIFMISHPFVEGKEDPLFLKAGIQPMKEKLAPNFRFENLSGQKVELKQLKGKVLLLNFWATWCGPCKEEMPSMDALYQLFKEKEFIFLTISVDYEDKKKVKEFIDKHRYSFPVLIDSTCLSLDLFSVKAIPTTFLIDKKGMMIGRAVGPKNWNSPEVVSILNMLLGKK